MNLTQEEIDELVKKYGQEYVDKLLEEQKGTKKEERKQKRQERREARSGEEGMEIPKKETGVLSKAMNALKLPFFK